MSDWILFSDRKPFEGQAVIYYFEFVGVHRGQYTEPNTFFGPKGFLGDDVTHWMPDEGQELPPPPNG